MKRVNLIKTLFCCLAVFLLSLPVICAQADVKAGDMISFGRWHQDADAQDSTPVLWRVLKVQGDKALLISDLALDARPYDLYRVDATWEQCTLRVWMNTELLSEAFTPDEQKAILVTANQKNGKNCPLTKDRLFLLNYSEAKLYLSAEQRIARYTKYASRKDGFSDISFSWTRESGRMINMLGTDCTDIFLISDNAVRPAMWVSLSAMAAPESAPDQDFTLPVPYIPEQVAQETPSEGTVYRCLLLRGPQWGGNKAQYGFRLTELMPDETVFYPEAGFPETGGPVVRERLDKMAQLADDDDVTYIIVAAHGEPDCYDFYLTSDYFSEDAYTADVLDKTTFAEKLAAIRGRVVVLSLSCYSGTLADYCGGLDPARYSIWMSCGNTVYSIGHTEEKLFKACAAVKKDKSGAIELGEIAAFSLAADGAEPCVFGNPENFVFPVKTVRKK